MTKVRDGIVLTKCSFYFNILAVAEVAIAVPNKQY